MSDFSENNKRIKVLALIWSMRDGGAQQVVLNHLRAMKEDEVIDYHLVVFDRKTDSVYDKAIMNESLPVEYLNYPKSPVKIPIIRGPFNLAVARRAWEKVIRSYAPDIIHVHISGLLEQTLDPVIRCKVPVRFDSLHSDPSRYKGIKLMYIRRAFVKYGFVPVCVTKEQEQKARERYGFVCSSEVLYNGVDFKAIRESIVAKDEARTRLAFPENSFVIAAVGRLDPVKNYPLLMRSFKQLLSMRNDSLLVFVGEGIVRSELEDLARKLGIFNNVRFLGRQSNVITMYCAADVMGVTSFTESSSLVLLEAQTCGLRCVISSGVPRESIITDHVQQMDKNADEFRWAEALNNTEYHGTAVCSEKDYGIDGVSEKLRDMYIRHWNSYIEQNRDCR